MKHNVNVTNEVLAFECRLFQSIWMLQSGDTAIFPRDVKEPIVPLFDEYRAKCTLLLLIHEGAYWSCWQEGIHSSHNSVIFLVTMFPFHLLFLFYQTYYTLYKIIWLPKLIISMQLFKATSGLKEKVAMSELTLHMPISIVLLLIQPLCKCKVMILRHFTRRLSWIHLNQ